MPTIENHDLLNAFVRGRSNEAFRQLVERYLGFVLGTAQRQVRNLPLAEEVAQSVFAILARKAEALRGEALPAWLHRTTLHQSHAAMRSEFRHRRKLAAFAAQPAPVSFGEGQSHCNDAVLCVLDESLARLAKSDQRVLLLRFFEGQSFAEIAETLGQSEAAVQRRGHRALERLGTMMRRRGHALSAAALASAFLALPAVASPILAAQLATRALAAAPKLSLATLLSHAIHALSTAQKLATALIVVGTAAAVPIAMKLGTSTLRESETAVVKEPVPSQKSPGAADLTAPNPPLPSPKKAAHLGHGKAQYDDVEAGEIARRLVEMLDINDSKLIDEKVFQITDYLRGGGVDPDDWEQIESLAKVKRRTRQPSGDRDQLMREAAAIFLKEPGRERGGTLAFVAYYLKQTETLPTDGSPDELQAYDWVRAAACVDRGALNGKAPEEAAKLESLARNHPGELGWNAAAMVASMTQGDWNQALMLAEEAATAGKLTYPNRSIDAASTAFRQEADARGGGSWLVGFSHWPFFHPYFTAQDAADKLFKRGSSLPDSAPEMADRCWRAAIGMMHVLETDRDVRWRSGSLSREKQYTKKLAEAAILSIYGRPPADVQKEIEAEAVHLNALHKAWDAILKSGDAEKIRNFQSASDVEGNFAVLERMQSAEQK